MNYQAVLARIMATVDDKAYQVPTAHVDNDNRHALQQIQQSLQEKRPASQIKAQAVALYKGGQLDEVHYLSAMHVIAASPQVKDYREAARLVAEQEMAALELGGPSLNDNLASVERHRGVLAFLQGHYSTSLDYFTRALERQRTPENMGNVLCVLLRLGESDEAERLLEQLTTTLPTPFIQALWDRVNSDPDLSTLRRTGE